MIRSKEKLGKLQARSCFNQGGYYYIFALLLASPMMFVIAGIVKYVIANCNVNTTIKTANL